MQTKAKFRFIEFIRPTCYWPHPYTLEQAFGVFRWMVQTGKPFIDQGRWGQHTVKSLLSKKPTCVNFSYVEPIVSIDDLRERFHYAILSDYVGPQLRAWREKFRIRPDGEAVISFPHHKWHTADSSEAEFASGLSALLRSEGQLGVRLNRCHSKARWIHSVQIDLHAAYSFRLGYGYPNDSSTWYVTLARQASGETFRATTARAVRKLAGLVSGNVAEANRRETA